MSAFIVIVGDTVYLRILFTINNTHLWEYQHTDLSAEEFIQLLRKRNFDSVNYRYRLHNVPYVWEPLKLEKLDDLKPYSPIELYKNLACIEYQSCELVDWYGCREEILLVRLQNDIAGDIIRNQPGYEEAGWGD